MASGSQSVSAGTVVPAQTEGFSYHNAGNLTADGQWSYTYDALNRLVAMEGFHDPVRPGQPVIEDLPMERDVRLEFRYDEQNRRVEKTVRDRFSGTVKKRERFLYQGWNLVATLDATDLNNIQVVSQYFWRTGSEDTGSFGLLMIAGDHDGDPGTTRRAYYTGYDGRGNLTSLAGQTRGVAAAAFEYSPFGERLRAEGTGQLPDLDALGVHFGFATQYTDRETGLVYFGHRYYHPGLGRFLNRDPLGEAGGLNRYLYASNDPINFTDYRGLCDADPGSETTWDSGREGLYYDKENNVLLFRGTAALAQAYVNALTKAFGVEFEATYAGTGISLTHPTYELEPFFVTAHMPNMDYGTDVATLGPSMYGGGSNGYDANQGFSGGLSGTGGASGPIGVEGSQPQQKNRWSDEDCAELASRIQNLESALPDVAELYGRRAAEFADLGGADALDYLGTSNLLLASGITGIQTAEFARLAGNAVWTERLGTAGTIHAYRGVRAPFLTPQAINGLKIAGRITAGAGIAIDAYNLATADNAYNATVSATNIGIAGYALSFGGPKTAWAAGWYFAGQGLGNFLSDRREYSREFSRLQGLVDEARDLSVYAGSALNQAQQDYQNHCQ